MSRPSNYIAPNGMTPLASVLAACEARKRKDAVIAKMIQFAIALPPDQMISVGSGVECCVLIYEHDGHEFRGVQLDVEGETVAAITWHGHFTDPAYSEHIYQPGPWDAAVLQ